MKPTAEPLTERQRAVLSAIGDYFRATGETPTLSYLSRRLGLDRSTVREHTRALHRKGHLRAPAPGPPLPIPPRDESEEDTPATSVEPAPAATSTLPVLPPSVIVEKHTPLGAAAPTAVTVRTLRRTRVFKVLRVAGQITGFVEETE